MHIKSCCGFGPEPSQLPAAFLRAVWYWSEKHCRVLGFLQHYETEVKREVSMYLKGCVFILTLSLWRAEVCIFSTETGAREI